MKITTLLISSLFSLCLPALASAQEDNIGHEHHLYRHGAPHPAAPDSSRFVTSREGAVLPLPAEEDAFFFVVYGDRTGGPPEGVSVLADAVHDTNLLEPDLVMTVGDLVNGYNETDQWMVQMREYKGIMDQLLCPWFPVAGNHDIYWRGSGQRPVEEHEVNYEIHFGPLWYAFEHKDCWFFALYSDEPNPETGERNFGKAECQRMSPEQLGWLGETLELAKDAQHVFLFLHHPRWIGGQYGDDWEKVHQLLIDAGNVTAVFAGHIHHMRYDLRDGIEYVTLATVGGAQGGLVPSAGYLHQFHTVTVRENQVAMSSIPVGAVMDPRAITGELVSEAEQLARVRPRFSEGMEMGPDGAVSGRITATVANPVGRSIEVTMFPESDDSRWAFGPDHHHQIVPPGGSAEFEFRVGRPGESLDAAFREVELVLAIDYLAEGFRYAIPETRRGVPLSANLLAPPVAEAESVLELDGNNGHLRIPASAIAIPDGPLTLECWINADRFTDRNGLLAKTESSEYGFFVNQGMPSFAIHIGGSYVQASDPDLRLEVGGWHHLAGVFDGKQTRLYVDGTLAAAVERSGARRTNTLPLMVGADVDNRANPVSFFDGKIDGVRLSTVARYSGDSFDPERRHASDADTALLLNMDSLVGPWLFDESPSCVHPTPRGGAHVVFEREEVSFASMDGLPMTADLYLADTDPETPFIVLFHQAGWSRGEYREIAPRLNALGFNCLAVDLRSGGEVNGVVNETAQRALKQQLGMTYTDALPDLIGSLEFARERWAEGELIAWGSSYSSALVLKVAGDFPELVDAVLAFAPGEYFTRLGKSETWVAESAAKITCPVFITSAKAEQQSWQSIFDAIPAGKNYAYLPETAGNHGSRALWSHFDDSAGYWSAVERFLEEL